MRRFFDELRRRNVFRVAAAFVAGSWLLIQVAETILPVFGLGEAAVRILVIVAAIGFIPALVFAWVYEMTPEGLKLERDVDRSRSIAVHTGKKLDRVIILVLAAAVVVFAIDKFLLEPTRDASRVQAAIEQGRSEALLSSFGDKSIAVLPFADMSPEKDQEYFSDGISEELLNLLARIPEMRVAGRTSAFSYKNKDATISEIGKQLNVAHILEGSIRKVGQDVRVTAQLIEATTDTHLWSETFDRTLDDIFSIQDEIAAAVVEKLKVMLLNDIPQIADVDSTAYEYYLKGQYFLDRVNEQKLTQAVAAFEKSIEIDPDYAPAWTSLAVAYRNQAQFGYRELHDGTAMARQALTHALSLDESYGRAWARLGIINTTYDWDFGVAETSIRRAYELAPGDISVLSAVARLAAILGRYDEAEHRYREAIVLEPLSLSTRMNLGWTQLYGDRIQAAEKSLGALAELDPTYPLLHCMLGQLRLLEGDPQAALVKMRQETAAEWRDYGIALALHSLGRSAEADAALARFIDANGQTWPYQVAVLHAHRRDIDQAFAWLDRAFDARDSGMVWLLGEPFLINLHDDPRWPALLDKMGLSH